MCRIPFGSNNGPVSFGELVANGDISDSHINKTDNDKEEALEDHHLRLSRTGRKHEPAWYLGKINKLCKDGATQEATELFFHKMLTVDRVMPDRNIIHVLLSGLAAVGDSETAFKVYRKMTEIGIAATNSTYSRLFRACTEDIAAWQREHRYDFNLSNSTSEKSWQPDLALFAGPALNRVKGLWLRLHERGFRMNRITYNALLQALGKAGDLHTCFQALDAMLLGRGGLPPSILRPSEAPPVPSTCSSEPLPPFRPDEYTLTAVLTAIKQSSKSGVVSSPLDALRLALHAWHLIVPRLPRRQPNQHHFTLLAGILGVVAPRTGRYSLPSPAGGSGRSKKSPADTHLEVIPESLPKLRSPQTTVSPRVLASEQAAKELLKRMSLIASGEEVPVTCTPTDTESAIVCNPENRQSSAATLELDWSDPNVTIRSPVNLLLPLPQEGVRLQLPPKEILPQGSTTLAPWQRLALVGGLEGFFDCIHTNFEIPLPTAAPLITKLVALLPPPHADTGRELDHYENCILTTMRTNKVALDLPILNTLLQRRTSHGLPVNELMALANREGLSPDEFTWACLARNCRTTKHVRDFLNAYSKAASSAPPPTESRLDDAPRCRKATVRPSLHVYGALLASTAFCWDSKVVILRSMMGSSQLNLKRKKKLGGASDHQTGDLPIPSDRRIVANLELEIANFRDLVARGVVPKDGSSVGACAETGGVIIPPYALTSFKKFIPIYKEWAQKSIVADPPTSAPSN
ncbi:unnamed protein product [Mesocestoides corti]|nr:unnamed protein product [Mesocestoides corti]